MACGHDPREIPEYPARDLLMYDMLLPILHVKGSAFYDPFGDE